MSIKQISVFLENKPGQLAAMTGLLADNNVDIRALSLAETQDFGIARMIVDDIYEAANVLRNGDFIANFSHVLAFAVPDTPGGLHQLLNAFNEAGVNVEYMYAFLGNNDASHAYMIFRVTDTKESEAKLISLGYRPLTQEEIAQI
ncbi:MAG: ACT domain-containing protein [Clostridia bacterium]|nr:ACT domain-containing protein [Clostridia bacterium]